MVSADGYSRRRMNIVGKIAFLERKLEHDRLTARASLLWAAGIVFLMFSGLCFSSLVPNLDGKAIVGWALSGTAGVSLPVPLKEYFARQQSLIALSWLYDQYLLIRDHPDTLDAKHLELLDGRFTIFFDKVVSA
jgi:hypothetical protein